MCRSLNVYLYSTIFKLDSCSPRVSFLSIGTLLIKLKEDKTFTLKEKIFFLYTRMMKSFRNLNRQEEGTTNAV